MPRKLSVTSTEFVCALYFIEVDLVCPFAVNVPTSAPLIVLKM